MADLGTDRVYYYTISKNHTKIQWNKDKSLTLAGSGPRHMAHGPKESNIVFLCG